MFLLEVVFELVFGVSSASLNAADVDAIDPANIAAYLVLVPLSLLISLLTTAAVIVHLHRIATNAPEGDAGVYAAALRRVLPYAGTSILYGIATVLGAILLIVPGVWLSIAFLLPSISSSRSSSVRSARCDEASPSCAATGGGRPPSCSSRASSSW